MRSSNSKRLGSANAFRMAVRRARESRAGFAGSDETGDFELMGIVGCNARGREGGVNSGRWSVEVCELKTDNYALRTKNCELKAIALH